MEPLPPSRLVRLATTLLRRRAACRFAARAALALLPGVIPAGAAGTFFGAYYTRLGYLDASEQALPGRSITGRHADIVVNLPAGRFVFSREFSYLPHWEVGNSRWPVAKLVPRSGNGFPPGPCPGHRRQPDAGGLGGAAGHRAAELHRGGQTGEGTIL